MNKGHFEYPQGFIQRFYCTVKSYMPLASSVEGLESGGVYSGHGPRGH